VSPIRPRVTVVGHRHDPEHHRLRDFLTRSAQPFSWIEADTAKANQLLARYSAPFPEFPVLIDSTGEVTTGATVERVVEVWRMNAEPARSSYDLAIVGAGPAGLAAAVYAASDGLSTIVLERDIPGGQAGHTSFIENYVGFPDGIGGAELSRLAGKQAERFGAEVMVLRGVTGHSRDPDGPFRLDITGGSRVEASVAIVAPGMVWRRLDVDGMEDMLGSGVYYGAGRSEAAQCGGDPVVVVGAGNSAGQAVMHLGNGGAHVTMVVRGDGLGKSMSAYLVDRIADHPLVDVRLRTEVEGVEADGDGRLAGVRVRDREGGIDVLPSSALFLCLGGTPRTAWAAEGGVRVDPGGFIITGPDLLDAGRRPEDWPLARDPLALETSVPGLFAAGDVRHGSTKRVAAAVGDGAIAVALVHRRLEELLTTG